MPMPRSPRRPASFRGRGTRFAARMILVAALLAGRPVGGQEPPPDFDQGLFELRLATGSAVTMTVLINPAGAPLLPLQPVFALAGYAPDRQGDSVRSIPAVGGGRAVLDLRRREIRRPSDTIALTAEDAVIVGREIFLEASRVGDLLQGEALVEWALLQVVLRRATPFPAERARSSEARRAALRDRVRYGAPAERSVPYAARTGAGVLAWTISDAIPDPGETLTGEAVLGLAVAGGDLTLGTFLRSSGSGPGGQGEATASYRRAFPTSSVIRQIQIGDMVTGGTSFQAFRGITVTNTRIVRDYFFADVPILPDVPSGWEYEVYQNGELLGYSDAGTRGAISVPLRYGSTPLQVRLLSPTGEEIVREVRFQIPHTQLPRHRFEYTAGGGECPELSACERYGFLKADYGVAHWLTLGAGVESSGDTLDRRARTFGSASYAGWGGWQGHFRIAHNLFATGTLGYYGEGPWNGQVGAHYTRPGVGQATFLETSLWRWAVNEVITHRPPRRWGPVRALRVESRLEGERGAGPDRRRVGLTADMPRGSLGGAWERDPVNPRGLYLLSALGILPSAGPRWLHNVAILGSLGFAPDDGLRQAEAATSVRTGRRSSLSLAVRWNDALPGASASLGFYTSLGFARSISRAVTTGGRTSGAATTLTGVAAFDYEYGVSGYEIGGPGLAGVAGTVFYDVDGNGVRDAGDSAAAGVNVIVGGRRERTNARGEFQTWNVVPYEIIELSVDTLRGIATNWIPLRRQVFLRATPHVYNRVDVPLVQTQEVAGRLVAGEGVWTAGGVTVDIRELATGTTISAVSFSDGEFYLSRVRPGSYELTVRASALEALGAVADPERAAFTVGARADETLLEIPPITLRKPAVAEERLELAAPPPPPPAPAPIFAARGVLVLRGVTFDVNRATLRPESYVILDTIAARLIEQAEVRIEVAGHSDITGSRAHNLRLSQARAEAVRDYFIAKGVAPDRVIAVGYGPDEPVATNATASGRALNRRTELKRIP